MVILRVLAVSLALLAPPTVVGTVLLNAYDAGGLAVGLFLLGLGIACGLTAGMVAERIDGSEPRDRRSRRSPVAH